MRSVVGCVECRVWSVECRVWSVECGVWSVECGVWSVECGVVWVGGLSVVSVWCNGCAGSDCVGSGGE